MRLPRVVLLMYGCMYVVEVEAQQRELLALVESQELMEGIAYM